MEIRVVVPDAEGASGLVQRLAELGDTTSLSVDSDTCAVRVRPEEASGPAIRRVLTTVANWLDEAAVDSADVWLDGHPYTLARRPGPSLPAAMNGA